MDLHDRFCRRTTDRLSDLINFESQWRLKHVLNLRITKLPTEIWISITHYDRDPLLNSQNLWNSTRISWLRPWFQFPMSPSFPVNNHSNAGCKLWYISLLECVPKIYHLLFKNSIKAWKLHENSIKAWKFQFWWIISFRLFVV